MKNKLFNIFIYVISILITISFLLKLSIFKYLNSFIWAIGTIGILSSGIFLSYKLGFPQLNFKGMLRSLKGNDKSNDGVSTFEALSLSLGARVGVGSLAGVALAIYLGGPGTILWMWVTVFISSSNTFTESVLGVIYQNKDTLNINVGGPSYYIKKGMGNNGLAIFYAIMIIISYILGFLTIQSNTIVKSVNTVVNIKPLIIILIISLCTYLVIFKGVKKIASFSSFIVPLMGIIYIIIGMFIVIKNIAIMPSIIGLIFKSAFNFKSFFGGFLGTFIIGIQKCLFSNESGLGTSAISSSTTNDKPIKQGYVQVLGIYITTLVVCTITALIILTSNYETLSLTDVNGIEITSYAFKYHLGNFGNILLLIIVILFAFSTLISGYYYGESSLKFLKPNISKKFLNVFKIISIILISLGGIVSSNVIWSLVDIFVVILIIVNIYAILHLYKDVRYTQIIDKK